MPGGAVGDVGRPDLLEKAANIKGTMEEGARTLYRSLQAFAKHEDWLQIWPGHGAGSLCGAGIGDKRWTGARDETEPARRARG